MSSLAFPVLIRPLASLLIPLVVALTTGPQVLGHTQGGTPTRDIAARAFPSVVLLISEDARGVLRQGSGFFVTPDVIVTNAHVINRGRAVAARVVGERSPLRAGRVIAIDARADLALLRFTGARGRPLPLADSDGVAAGDTVFAIGNPEGLEGTLTQGIVSQVRRASGLIQIDAAISHGSSGGPVLNTRGEVIGVAVGSVESGQNLNFAIPSSTLGRMLDRAGIAYTLGAAGRSERAGALPSGAMNPVDEWTNVVRLYNAGRFADARFILSLYTERNPGQARAWELLGLTKYALKDTDGAIAAFDRALRLEPNLKAASAVLCRASQDARKAGFDTPNADTLAADQERVCAAALKLDPGNEDLLYLLADAYVARQRFPEAIATYRKQLDVKPTDDQAWYEIGDLYGLTDDWERAYTALKRSVDLRPDDHKWVVFAKSAMRTKRFPEAIEAYHKRLAYFDRPGSNAGDTARAEAWLNIGVAFLKLNDGASAEPAFESSIKLGLLDMTSSDADTGESFGLDGIVGGFQKIGRVDIALRLARTAADMRPQSATILGTLSKLLVDVGRADEALEVAKAGVAAEPDDVIARIQLARCFVATKRIDEAISTFKNAIPLSAGEFARMELVSLYRGLERYDDVVAECREGLRAFPQDDQFGFPVLRIELAAALEKLGKLDEALAEYRAALDGNPAKISVVTAYGDALVRAKRYPDAVALYKQALRTSTNGEILAALAESYEHSGRTAEANELYEKALSTGDSSAAMRVGLAHENANRLMDALRAYRRALEIDPKDWDCRAQLAKLYLKLGDRKAAIAEYERIKPEAPAIAASVFDAIYK